MKTWRAFFETVHLTMLGLWLGVLVMTGTAAAIIFPTMKGLNPSLPGYAGYAGDHWLIAAGQPAARFFVACDVVQMLGAVLTVLTMSALLIYHKLPVRRPAVRVRVLASALAVIGAGTMVLWLGPQMHFNAKNHWDAAKLGNNEVAEKYRQAFDADHPVSTKLIGGTTLCVLVALVSGAWCVATPERLQAAGTRTEDKPSRYEEPMLARGRA